MGWGSLLGKEGKGDRTGLGKEWNPWSRSHKALAKVVTAWEALVSTCVPCQVGRSGPIYPSRSECGLRLQCDWEPGALRGCPEGLTVPPHRCWATSRIRTARVHYEGSDFRLLDQPRRVNLNKTAVLVSLSFSVPEWHWVQRYVHMKYIFAVGPWFLAQSSYCHCNFLNGKSTRNFSCCSICL